MLKVDQHRILASETYYLNKMVTKRRMNLSEKHFNRLEEYFQALTVNNFQTSIAN